MAFIIKKGMCEMPRISSSPTGNNFSPKAVNVGRYFLSKDPKARIFPLQKKVLAHDFKHHIEGVVRLSIYMQIAQNIHIAWKEKPLFRARAEAREVGAIYPFIQEKFVFMQEDTTPVDLDSETRKYLDIIYNLLKNATTNELIELSRDDIAWCSAYRVDEDSTSQKTFHKLEPTSVSQKYICQYSSLLVALGLKGDAGESGLKVGDVLHLRLTEHDDNSTFYLVIGCDEQNSYAKVTRLTPLKRREHMAALRGNLVVSPYGGRDAALGKSCYINRTDAINIEQCDEIISYRCIFTRIEEKKLAEILGSIPKQVKTIRLTEDGKCRSAISKEEILQRNPRLVREKRQKTVPPGENPLK